MYYPPLQVKSGSGPKYTNLTMPKKGMNLETLPQMMDTNYATKIVNLIPFDGGLEKRGGKEKIFERAGASPVTLLKRFTTNVWIFGYSTKIEAYNESTDSFTTIKDDFSANNGFGGVRVGQYFLVCNGVEKIHRIDDTLSISVISNAPICNGLKVIGNRVVAYNLSSDESAVYYSPVDDGTNPPFNDWSITTAADTAGNAFYRNAGAVRSVVNLNGAIVAFCDRGFFAFSIDTIDSGGTLRKVENIQNYTEDYGGATGAIETPIGVFYFNEIGLWHMVSVGQSDVPMSVQQQNLSKMLGSDYFKDIDQTSVDIVHAENIKSVLITYAKDSETNNKVLGYRLDRQAFYEIEGWNINRFAKDGQDIYGASSTKTTVYKLFEGYDDDGQNIGTIYEQEIPLKTLFHKHQLNGAYAGGYLSPSTHLDIEFDIYDRDGCLLKNKTRYRWSADEKQSEYDEWASAQFAGSSWAGDYDLAGLVESFGGGSPRINNLQRLIIRVVGGDKMRHILNWISVKTRQKGPIRRRNFTQLT